MGFIADLSRYDPTEAVDLYDGVILNVEDPGFGAKRDRAVAKGVPWGTYSWVYPGAGVAAAERALIHSAGGPLGAWLDYEQQGVNPSDLTAALKRGDELGIHLGVYTYLYILPSVKDKLGDHPLWLAYYPWPNSGKWESSFSDDARAAGALLHQFTSSNGQRDLNVVLDPERWAAWTGTEGDDDMAISDDDLTKIGFKLLEYHDRFVSPLKFVDGSEASLLKWIGAALKVQSAGGADALAAAVVAKLPAAGGLTQADVESALRNVLHSV